MNWLSAFLQSKKTNAVPFPNIQQGFVAFYTLVIRWVLPVLAVCILIRCILPLLSSKKEGDTPCGYLILPDGRRIPLIHWENSIGRSKLSDIVLPFSFISRSHAVLTYSDGEWTVTNLSSSSGVWLNGTEIAGKEPVKNGDTISLGGFKLILILLKQNEFSPSQSAFTPGETWQEQRFRPAVTLAQEMIFQFLGCLQLCFAGKKENVLKILIVFSALIIMESAHFLVMRCLKKRTELDLLAYFLCTVGLFVAASASPVSLPKQMIAIMIGACCYFALILVLQNLNRAQALRKIFMICAFALMLLNLFIGKNLNGARNWIYLGPLSFQPMEFVKIAFVLAGTATLDRLLTTRNLTSFILFSGACIGTLAVIKDFGTALVFFCAFLVIAFLRSGDIRTIALISAGALLGAGAVISFMPYVASRFKAWGHVWQYADSSGYQQTRTLIAIASGGLLGTGGGNGYLCRIAAADTDLVFGVVCEEWGLVIALAAAASIVFFTVYVILSIRKCRSSFYAIAACGAVTMYLVQTALNIFGSVDILPLTGVTMPFVSKGGSSMIVSWCLLAFIKSMSEQFRSGKFSDE